jgi:hypothetical protein
MIRAFIVKLDVEDISTLQDTAMDIEDDLAAKGHLVISVAPWKGHGIVAAPPTPVLPSPPIV